MLAIAVAALAVLLGLALPRPASALVSETNITSPASPYRVFYDLNNPGASPTVSGTANGPTAVDINCYYPPNPDYGTLTPAHLATNVTVTAGAFSTPISLASATSIPCVMRAVPHGDTTQYPPGQSSSYTGPQTFVGQTTRTTSGGRLQTFLAYPVAELGELDIAAPDEEGLYWSSVDNPADLTRSPQFFAGVGALYSGTNSQSDSGHSDVRVDNVDAYDPDTANGNAGSPSATYSYSFDPASGDLTIHDTEPYVKCDDGPCSTYSSTGIELERTWQVSHENSVIAMTDAWLSTDGHQHSLDLTYEEQIGVTSNRSSFLFPGSSSFVTHDAGDTVTLPSGAGSILIKDDSTTPDSGGVYGQGAISYASAPDGPAQFVYSDDNGYDPEWVMPYQRTVPAGGSVTLRFSYEQNHAMPDVRSAAAAAEESFKPALTIASPADGSTTSTPSVTVSGTASDAVQLSSLSVNGAAVPAGAAGSWSHAVGLAPGANTITALATNSDGNTSQRHITVNYVPPAAPNPAPSAHLAFAGGLHRLPAGVRFTLACTVSSCSGQAALTTTERLRGRTLVGVSAAKRPKLRKKTVAVGRVKFTIDAGKRRTITVSLNRTGKKLLKKFHKLPARLKITLAQPGGTTATVKNAKL
ncbi:MAG TPA: Ig-like domain-containing protein, partial [Thermoleophilaceae bacterium]|nr:Ig-like domain-containing protein [Thermoleophilaceae bacterium]